VARFQYSLRALLIVVALCSLPFAWVASLMRQINLLGRQAEIRVELENLGAGVRTDSHESFWLQMFARRHSIQEIRGIYFGGPRVQDSDLAILKRCEDFPTLRYLEICECTVTDDGLKNLAELRHLETLDLRGTLITGKGLAHLGKLVRLGRLGLAGTAIDDESLTHLFALEKLSELDVSDTGISGRGFRHLACHPGLTKLVASGTVITPEGLRHLGGLANLTILVLRESKLDDCALHHLGNLDRLQALDLSDTGVSATALATLPRIRSLRFLCLDGLPLNDSDLPGLSVLDSPDYLSLERTGITADGIRGVKNRGYLRAVYVSHTSVTEEAAVALSKDLGIAISLNGKTIFVGTKERPLSWFDLEADKLGFIGSR